MSVITTHMISPINPDFDLIGKLKEKNILTEKTIYRYNKNNEVVSQNSLIVDYTACDKTQADAELKKLKEEGRVVETFDTSKGVIEKYEAMGFAFDKAFSKENSHYRFRQEWDERVLNTLLTMPVSIRDAKNRFAENTVFWFLKYRSDEVPAFYIAKAFPEEEFRYTEEIEGDVIYDVTIKGGEVITNHLKEISEEDLEKY